MKKNLTKLMALIMALALVLAFAACGKDPTTDTSTDPSTDAVSESETDTAPVDNVDPTGDEPSSDPTPAGPVDLVKPADAAAAIKMYNDAVGKISSTKGTYSRVMDEGTAGKGFINISIKTPEVEEKFNLDNEALPNAKLYALDAGSVASMSAKEEGNNIVIDFTLNEFTGNQGSKHGNGGFMYFIDIEEATKLVGDIGGAFGVEIKVYPEKATLNLSGGKFSVTLDKTTGKLTKATLSFTETLDARVNAPLKDNLAMDANAFVKGHGTANYVLG